MGLKYWKLTLRIGAVPVTDCCTSPPLGLALSADSQHKCGAVPPTLEHGPRPMQLPEVNRAAWVAGFPLEANRPPPRSLMNCWVRALGMLIEAQGMKLDLGGSTTTFPLNGLVMELAVLLEELQIKFVLQWLPRDLNEEADRLSKGDYRGFDPVRRLPVHPADLEWTWLPQLM